MELINDIQAGDTLDIGSAIQGLISDNIQNINTAFLGTIKSIEKNKLEIIPTLKHKDSEDVVISGVSVGCLYSGSFTIQFQLKVNDIGLCIVCQNDITNYKKEGSNGLLNTHRIHNINDIIFLPLSMFNQENNDDLGLNISNSDKTLQIELKNDLMTIKSDKLEITANEIKLNSEQPLDIGSKKSIKDCFNAIFDNLESGIKGGITVGSPSTQKIETLPMMSIAINKMKTVVNEALK